MALKHIMLEIQKLSIADQYRLKEFFVKSLAFYTASEPIYKEVSERKHKDGFTCSHCHSNNAVRFGTYNVKMGTRTIVRERTAKTFTDLTNNPLHGTQCIRKSLVRVEY